MHAINAIVGLLSEDERKKAILLLLLTGAMAVFEVVGVTAIMPFVTALTKPGSWETNGSLHFIYELFGAPDPNRFLILLAGATIAALTLSALVRSIAMYAQQRFVQLRRYELLPVQWTPA